MRGDPSTTETSPSGGFGQLLRRLRRERGLTQRELARRLGLSQATICSYEAGRKHPSLQRLSTLARALRVPEGELAPLLPERATPSTPFGRALRELRERRGWTQEQLAGRIGCTAGLISDYEVTGKLPGPKYQGVLAAALGVPRRRLRALVAKRTPPRRTTALGRLLRETRIARGMTQRQLAEAVGLTAQHIASYEGANCHPREKHRSRFIKRLAKALDVSPAEIEESLSRQRPVNVPTDFGHRVRQLRVDRGLTQEQLGARCGCSFNMISHYETGVSYPKPDLLPALAKTLDVGVGEFERLLPRLRREIRTTPFGSELRRLREERGWTQGQLAKRAGLGWRLISAYEARSTYPRPRTLAALARGLGVSHERLEQQLPPEPKTTPFGRELKRLREELGLTQTQLAERIGRESSNISAYERGQQRPGVNTLPALAGALGVSRERLEQLLPPRPTTSTPFGRAVRELRERHGWTQEELATRSGCSEGSIRQYEHDRSLPEPRVAAALARALGVSEQRLQL